MARVLHTPKESKWFINNVMFIFSTLQLDLFSLSGFTFLWISHKHTLSLPSLLLCCHRLDKNRFCAKCLHWVSFASLQLMNTTSDDDLIARTILRLNLLEKRLSEFDGISSRNELTFCFENENFFSSSVWDFSCAICCFCFLFFFSLRDMPLETFVHTGKKLMCTVPSTISQVRDVFVYVCEILLNSI